MSSKDSCWGFSEQNFARLNALPDTQTTASETLSCCHAVVTLCHIIHIINDKGKR